MNKMIEPAHLAELFNENEITIAEAAEAGSSSTAAAYAAQQQIIRDTNRRPDVHAEADVPSREIMISGFAFQQCTGPNCWVLTDTAPCTQHQPHARAEWNTKHGL